MATMESSDLLNSSTAEDDGAFKDAAVYFTAMFGYPITFVIGFMGNLLCLFILNLQNMRTSTNVYLSALAVSDLMKNINDFMYFPTVLLLRNGNTKLYGIYYPFGFFLSQFAASCSAWLTVSVAFERLLMVVYPACSRGLLNVNKARVMSMIVCTSILIFSIPCALRYRTICRPNSNGSASDSHVNISTCVCDASPMCTSYDVETTTLWQNKTFKSIYTILQSCVRSLVPLIILIYLNVRIIISLHQTRASHRLASRNRITLMLIVVVCCFIAFATPDAIMSLMGWGYHEAMSNFRRGIREITDMLLAMNSSINVFLYSAFNRAFRNNLKYLCYCSATDLPMSPGARSYPTTINRKSSRSNEDMPLRRSSKASPSNYKKNGPNDLKVNKEAS